MTAKAKAHAGKEAPEPPRVVLGFIVPKPGPHFEAALRREAELALGRIWACLKAELSLDEARELFAELFEPFRVTKEPGRPRLSKSKEDRLLRLSDVFSRREIAFKMAGKPGWPVEPDAIEKAVQRVRQMAKRPAKKKLISRKPLKNK